MHVKHSLAYLEIHENFPINRYCFQYITIYFYYRNLNKNVHTVYKQKGMWKSNISKLFNYWSKKIINPLKLFNQPKRAFKEYH